ncbi:hypothetical protein CSC94_06935 [Zhengella mangrovi]|uniref:Uncharacterized protein n=1 Tax=Zhengella mangrovi TaxID=1982044 RepID=A0A2G1QPF9_9HYPH|nr:hypothetical protein [Zhengella mangrovi]PHP67437.1 hypothetical protein CSC94_06935 [Zhengella mangrovi]
MKILSATMVSTISAALALFAATAHSATFNQTIGDQWKQQCTGQGRYTCCKRKEKQCINDGISDSNCGQRYKQCVKLFRPGRDAFQSKAPGNIGVIEPRSFAPGILVRPMHSGRVILE